MEDTTASLSLDEQMAASTMASLSQSARKRDAGFHSRNSNSPPRDDGDATMAKRPKLQHTNNTVCTNKNEPASNGDAMSVDTPSNHNHNTEEAVNANPNNETTLRPAPFFRYTDYSTQPDPDPLTPLTAPGRVPNFPAKMHSILSRPDLCDVVCWMPHGRSWRVLKPREFEVRVLPTYFEHAKFSSFIRQANGWGFRRMTKGNNRNSYYHELFLRGLPHLAKHMKRPGVAQKKQQEPTQEPDLAAISAIHPVPENLAKDDETNVLLLECTLQGGPKARMPIYTGAASILGADIISKPPALQEVQQEQQRQQAAMLQQWNSIKPPAAAAAVPSTTTTTPALPPQVLPSAASLPGLTAAASPHLPSGWNPTDPLAGLRAMPPSTWALAAAMQEEHARSAAASQFAAGFAAATAYSQQQFRNLLGDLAAAQQQNQNP